jgi:uncharacterized membrane protein
MVEKDSVFVAYILGIISIVMALITPFAGLLFGIIGLVQGSKQKNELAKKARNLNIIGIVLSVLMFIAIYLLSKYASEYLGTLA